MKTNYKLYDHRQSDLLGRAGNCGLEPGFKVTFDIYKTLRMRHNMTGYIMTQNPPKKNICLLEFVSKPFNEEQSKVE